MKNSHLLPLLAIAALLMLPPHASAQPPADQGRGATPPPPPMTNLQVLPKDMPRPQVIAAMQQMRQALGVECAYCHVDEGRGGRTDFAVDEKPTKNTARLMMRMTGDVNATLSKGLNKSNPVSVSCITCHRGVPIPKQLPAILADTTAEKGTAAAIAQYRDLRKQYYGAMAYDFSENALITMASSPTAKPDEAIQWLQLNVEFYPKSARSYLAMAQVYSRKPDKDNAIKSLEKALEIEPDNAQAKRMLDQLKSGH